MEADKKEWIDEEINAVNLSLISLFLERGYKGIFSDFDPRPNSERAISVDFLDEMKRATRDTPSGEIELRLSIPKNLRSLPEETTIRKRLREHFQRHSNILKKEIEHIKKRGFSFVFLGVALIVASEYLFQLETQYWGIHLLRIILEPGGWFLGWTGLDQLFYGIKEITPEYNFYKKMANCIIKFSSY